MEDQVGELVAERFGVLLVCEDPILDPPVRDRVDDATDELLDRSLALGRAELAAEVLGDDHVGRHLRPVRGELHLFLLEDSFAALVIDRRVTKLPLHLIEWVDTFRGEEPLELQALAAPLELAGALALA